MSKKSKKLFIETIAEEDRDIFLKNLVKQVQRLNKKLVEIDELELKQKQGTVLQENQLIKLQGKQDLLTKKAYYSEVSELYASTFKEANISLSQLVQLQNGQPTTEQQKQPATQQPVQQQQVITERIVEKEVFVNNPEHEKEILLQILNLSNVAEYFRDESSRSHASQYGVTEKDVQVIYEFFRKVLLYSEGANFEKIASKRQTALEDLQKYLKRDESVVLLNTKYRQIHDNVEKIASNSSFLQQSINIEIKQQSVIGSIGSEIKPRKESVSQQQQHHHVTQQAHQQQPQQPVHQTQQQQPQQQQTQQVQQHQPTEQPAQTTTQTETEAQQSTTETTGGDNTHHKQRSDGNDRRYNNGRGSERGNGRRDGGRDGGNRGNQRGGNRRNNENNTQEEPKQLLADDDWHEVGKKKPQTPQGGFKPRGNGRGGDNNFRGSDNRRRDGEKGQFRNDNRRNNNRSERPEKQEGRNHENQGEQGTQQQYIKKGNSANTETKTTSEQ